MRVSIEATVVVPDADRLIAVARERHRESCDAMNADGLSAAEASALFDLPVEQRRAHPRYVPPELAISGAVDAVDYLVDHTCLAAGLEVESSSGRVLELEAGWRPPPAVPDAVGVKLEVTLEIPNPPLFVRAMRGEYERSGGEIDVGEMTDEDALAVCDWTIEEKRAHPSWMTPEEAIPSPESAALRLLQTAFDAEEAYLESAAAGIARRVREPRRGQRQRHSDAQRRRLRPRGRARRSR